MVILNSDILIITLNVSEFKTPLIRQRLSFWIKKENNRATIYQNHCLVFRTGITKIPKPDKDVTRKEYF